MKSFNALAAASSMVAPKDLNMKEPSMCFLYTLFTTGEN